MKIDYAAIIEKANARKDALMAFQQAAVVLKDEMVAFEEDTLQALTNYVKAYKALDPEALKLIPSSAGHAVWVLVEDLLEGHARMDRSYNPNDSKAVSGRQGLAELTS